MRGRSEPPESLALVVLVARDGDALSEIAGSFYLVAGTCLNQLARLARLLPADLRIAITFGHTEWKWSGRGQAVALCTGVAPRSAKKIARRKR